MATYLIDLSPDDMQRRLGDALASTSTRCATRAAPRTSGRRCGWSTSAGAGGRPWRPSKSEPPRRPPTPPDLSNAPTARGGLRLLRSTRPVVAAAGGAGSAARRHAAARHRPADDELLRAHRTAHPSRRPGPRPRRGTGPATARRPRRERTCCCPPPRSTARPTAPGGCTGGSGSPMSSAATTSPATPGRSRSWAGRLPLVSAHRSGTMTWCAPRPRPPQRRCSTLVMLLLLVAPMAVGCVRVRASITVSPDDRVSGQIIAAAKPRDAERQGPAAAQQPAVRAKGGGLGLRRATTTSAREAVFSDLTFAELPQLANMNRDAAGVDISLRRAGNLVILEGRVDLTSLTDPDADVALTVSFPGEVTSTNGDRVDHRRRRVEAQAGRGQHDERPGPLHRPQRALVHRRGDLVRARRRCWSRASSVALAWLAATARRGLPSARRATTDACTAMGPARDLDDHRLRYREKGAPR